MMEGWKMVMGTEMAACVILKWMREEEEEGSCHFAEYCEMHQVSAGGGWSTELVVFKTTMIRAFMNSWE
jgi:hypothetical protein